MAAAVDLFLDISLKFKFQNKIRHNSVVAAPHLLLLVINCCCKRTGFPVQSGIFQYCEVTL